MDDVKRKCTDSCNPYFKDTTLKVCVSECDINKG